MARIVTSFFANSQMGYRSAFFFFFNDTATTEIYTLSLHDALPIYSHCRSHCQKCAPSRRRTRRPLSLDRKSTRLNSSHANISYAVFCLKKKKRKHSHSHRRYATSVSLKVSSVQASCHARAVVGQP